MRDWCAAARALPSGALVILRARDRAARHKLAEILSGITHVRLVIADDPDLAVSFDGLHLPERRAHEAGHWRARFPDRILTASAHSLSALIRLQKFDLDALLLSPVFPTASHANAPALTPARAALIAAASRRPVYALGGITAQNARLLAPAFDGIAAIGGFTGPASS